MDPVIIFCRLTGDWHWTTDSVTRLLLPRR
jgi:hypothetical protein